MARNFSISCCDSPSIVFDSMLVMESNKDFESRERTYFEGFKGSLSSGFYQCDRYESRTGVSPSMSFTIYLGM